jgi:hypothetical protein
VGIGAKDVSGNNKKLNQVKFIDKNTLSWHLIFNIET